MNELLRNDRGDFNAAICINGYPTERNLLSPIRAKQWSLVKLISIDQAAFLMAGIDPNDMNKNKQGNWINTNQQYTSFQFNSFKTYKQAIVSALLLGEISAYSKIWVFNCSDNSIAISENNLAYCGINDIDTEKTVLQTSVFIQWLNRQEIKTMRQILKQNALTQNQAATDKPPITNQEPIKQTEPLLLDYKPKHHNPALETVLEVSREYYDSIEQTDKPIKQEYLKEEVIPQKLKEKGASNISNNIVSAIDNIARPPIFKTCFKKH